MEDTDELKVVRKNSKSSIPPTAAEVRFTIGESSTPLDLDECQLNTDWSCPIDSAYRRKAMKCVGSSGQICTVINTEVSKAIAIRTGQDDKFSRQFHHAKSLS